MPRSTCPGCDSPDASGGLYCEPCKAEMRRLHELRKWLAEIPLCDAEAETRELRIELYESIIAHGGMLFEDGWDARPESDMPLLSPAFRAGWLSDLLLAGVRVGR